jgi:two-component system, NtrC family, response regulator HupR/HoxA
MVQPPNPREPRVPLLVRVTAEPALADCWTVNVSSSGIGLSCSGRVAAREGDRLRLSFSLPGSEMPLRTDVVVTWLVQRGAERAAIGARIVSMSAADRGTLGQYLRDRRFEVVVGLAPGALELAKLEGYARIHAAGDATGVIELLRRGDVAALVLFNDAAGRGVALVDELWSGDAGLAKELVPPIIVCGSVPGAELVRLFNAGRLYRVLPARAEAHLLERAIQEACDLHGEQSEQRRAVQALQRALARRDAPPPAKVSAREDGLATKSPAMRAVLDLARRVAPYKTSVLLVGETGAGKEVMAALIHELGPRSDESLVVQDCGVLTSTLLDSELFGHVRGAFTGAIADNPGLFVAADGGTIFLDEIENTTPELQAKLLRVIENGTLRPVGGQKTRQVDVRVIAASNRDLRREVEAGRFRADLYYRLNTFPLRIPPLRERREDIMPLAEHFLAMMRARLERNVGAFTAAAKRWLVAHTWPGNIRELRNVVERAVLLGDAGKPIDVSLLADAGREGPAPAEATSLRGRVQEAERALIAAALAQNDGVLRRAARALSTSPVTLRRKALGYGLLGG